MDILVYEEGIERDQLTVAVIDWKNFDKKVKKRPEDYVFILSPDEMDKFLELNRRIFDGAKAVSEIDKDLYAKQYPGLLVICALGLQPDFIKRYKVGHFTHEILGPAHAVFYINRSTDAVKRSNAVLKRIIDFKANADTVDDKNN